MKYLGLIHDGKEYTRESQIDEILSKNKFYWLIDSEVEDAVIELKKDTIIWHRGNYYSGNWHYGIFKAGNFYGIWEDGIFEKKGNFGGKWMGGIKEE